MKRNLFFAMTALLLLYSCDDGYHYYYDDPYPSSSGSSEIFLNGIVIQNGDSLPADSVEVRFVFDERPYDTLYGMSNAEGAFTHRYYYNGNRSFYLLCVPSDTAFASEDSVFNFSGRDLSAGHFDFSITLDSL